MFKNKQCAARIRKVIDHYNALAGLSKADGAETSLSDLLADIKHYCQAKQIDFDDLLRRANGYFADEVQGAKLKLPRTYTGVAALSGELNDRRSRQSW